MKNENLLICSLFFIAGHILISFKAKASVRNIDIGMVHVVVLSLISQLHVTILQHVPPFSAVIISSFRISLALGG